MNVVLSLSDIIEYLNMYIYVLLFYGYHLCVAFWDFLLSAKYFVDWKKENACLKFAPADLIHMEKAGVEVVK